MMGYAMPIERCIPPMGEEFERKTTIALQGGTAYEDALAALSPGNQVGRRIVDHLMAYGVRVPESFDRRQSVARLCEHIRHSVEGDSEQVEEAIRAVRNRLAALVPVSSFMPLPAVPE